jgi:hypothetical protein
VRNFDFSFAPGFELESFLKGAKYKGTFLVAPLPMIFAQRQAKRETIAFHSWHAANPFLLYLSQFEAASDLNHMLLGSKIAKDAWKTDYTVLCLRILTSKSCVPSP